MSLDSARISGGMYGYRAYAPAGRWAQRARLAILAAIDANPRAEGGELRKAIEAAYPFGENAFWPRKMWVRERKIALAALAAGPDRRCAGCAALLPPWCGERCRPCADATDCST